MLRAVRTAGLRVHDGACKSAAKGVRRYQSGKPTSILTVIPEPLWQTDKARVRDFLRARREEGCTCKWHRNDEVLNAGSTDSVSISSSGSRSDAGSVSD
jgi:hypothetical protein